MAKRNPQIVVIGGGTGSFTLLQALKWTTPNLTALVNMADDGGSSGMLRDELGVLPPGDVRQCLVALSRSPKIRNLFGYRFEEGTLEGHSFGNLFLTALEKLTGSFAEAVETASEVLNITGKVVPITLDNVRLVLKASDGFTVRGEGKIDVLHFSKPGHKPELSLDPSATIAAEAREALREAELIVIAPGDIYTSIGPLLIVDGVAEALRQTKAKIVYVCNLVVKPGQTNGMSVADHAAEIERFAGGPVLDYVLYNTAEPPIDMLEHYAHDQEFLVGIRPEQFKRVSYQAFGHPLIASQQVVVNPHDKLGAHRSLIRHDARAVAVALLGLLS